MGRSGDLELPCSACLADEAGQPRARIQIELHVGKGDRFEFRRSGSFCWKRAIESTKSILSTGIESRGRILQPAPSVQLKLQLCVAVWERPAVRKRRCWSPEQADWRMAMEWKSEKGERIS